MYLWAALQNHITLQGYIEFDFITHSDASSVVVEHPMQTHFPMAMHEDLKSEMVGVKASAKASAASVDKLESKMARRSTDISKLQQHAKVALKK
jgi:hypothetical protein